MEKYEQISVVGEGSYGVVMKCKHKETDQIVAVKKFLETEEDPTIRKLALREIRMLKRLKHENLVTMLEVFRHRKRFYIVFEFMEGTVLDELEKLPGGLGEERTRERIIQVCRAISYCHANHIIHRDVKPENVLVSSLGVVKLCDFGFARIISLNGEACTEYVATRWYRAPELLVSEPVYGSPVDIWAIGCLFAEMLTGDPLFPGESDIDQLFLICRVLGKPCMRHQQLMTKNSELRPMIKTPSQESLGFYKLFQSWPHVSIDFLNGCMKMDPQHRLTADGLLKHTYFNHDKFPQRFLPALREKVNIEFNAPLMRKLKTEILISTDRRDDIKPRKMSNGDNKWRFSLTEGTIKRKYNNDNLEIVERNLITLSKSTQRLNTLNNDNSQQAKVGNTKSNPKFKKPISIHHAETLEESLESIVKIGGLDNEDNSDKKPILPESPTFQTFHFAIEDYHSKSPNIQNILHPSINNIHFNRDLPKNVYNNYKISQGPPHQSRNHFLKKLDRNVVIENIFGQGELTNQTPHWFNSFTTSNGKKRDLVMDKSKTDEFTLPVLPGVATDKLKKKPQVDLLESEEVTPDYRYKRAKRKRNILDISLPIPVKERSRFTIRNVK